MLFRMISLEICGKIARGACRVAVDGWWLRRSSAGVKSSTASASGLGLWDPPTLPPVHHPVQLPTKITKKNGKNCSKTSKIARNFLRNFKEFAAISIKFKDLSKFSKIFVALKRQSPGARFDCWWPRPRRQEADAGHWMPRFVLCHWLRGQASPFGIVGHQSRGFPLAGAWRCAWILRSVISFILSPLISSERLPRGASAVAVQRVTQRKVTRRWCT